MTPPQHMEALARAVEVRIAAARQRRILEKADQRTKIRTLINPPAELSTYKIGTLLAPSSTNPQAKGVIPRVGPNRLNRAFRRLEAERPLGRRWHRDIHLRDLTSQERRHLARILFDPSTYRKDTP